MTRAASIVMTALGALVTTALSGGQIGHKVNLYAGVLCLIFLGDGLGDRGGVFIRGRIVIGLQEDVQFAF